VNAERASKRKAGSAWSPSPGTLAITPHIAGGLGLQAAPVRVEAALLTILVFAGVNVAWLLLFEDAPSDYAPPSRADQPVRRDDAGHDRVRVHV
jgi:hypothetical protein